MKLLMVCAAMAALSSVDALAPAMTIQNTMARPNAALRARTHQTTPQQPVHMAVRARSKPASVVRAQSAPQDSMAPEEFFEFVESTNTNQQEQEATAEGVSTLAIGGFLSAAAAGAYLASKKFFSPEGSVDEKKPLALNSMNASAPANVETLLDLGKYMTENKQSMPQVAALAMNGKLKIDPKKSKVNSGKLNIDPKKNYKNLGEATKAGLVQGIAPFPEGVDFFKFFDGISESEAQRYADVEITHGRVCMLAALGFLVGEQVEGSSFLFDADVTGPAINHFQQVPALFWGLIGASIFVVESNRVQIAWQNPFDAEKIFLLKKDFTPGDYGFDPLGLAKGKDEAWLKDMKLKEVNNGRVAMIAISGMVAQELVNGLNLIPADEVLEMGKVGAFSVMEKQCAGQIDEAACAKAFEAAERAAVFAANGV